MMVPKVFRILMLQALRKGDYDRVDMLCDRLDEGPRRRAEVKNKKRNRRFINGI